MVPWLHAGKFPFGMKHSPFNRSCLDFARSRCTNGVSRIRKVHGFGAVPYSGLVHDWFRHRNFTAMMQSETRYRLKVAVALVEGIET